MGLLAFPVPVALLAGCLDPLAVLPVGSLGLVSGLGLLALAYFFCLSLLSDRVVIRAVAIIITQCFFRANNFANCQVASKNFLAGLGFVPRNFGTPEGIDDGFFLPDLFAHELPNPGKLPAAVPAPFFSRNACRASLCGFIVETRAAIFTNDDHFFILILKIKKSFSFLFGWLLLGMGRTRKGGAMG